MIRENQYIQIVFALILGVVLDYFTGFARQFTAPVFINFADFVVDPYSPSITSSMIVVNSTHAFFQVLSLRLSDF